MADRSSPINDLITERYAGKTTAVEHVVIVTSGAWRWLSHNPNRIGMTLLNEGIYDIRIGFGYEPTASSGWLLAARGGTIEINWESDSDLVTAELYAIAVNALGPKLRILEVLRI